MRSARVLTCLLHGQSAMLIKQSAFILPLCFRTTYTPLRQYNSRTAAVAHKNMGDDTPAVLSEAETRVAEMGPGFRCRETTQTDDDKDNPPTTATAASRAEIEKAGTGKPQGGDGGDDDPTAVVTTGVKEALGNGHQSKVTEDEEETAAEIAPSSEPPRAPVEAELVAATRKRKAPSSSSVAPAAAESSAEPAPRATGLAVGVKIEGLAQAVRERVNEVLQKGEDDEMRRDARLVNFLGEVEEAQVRSSTERFYAILLYCCYYCCEVLLYEYGQLYSSSTCVQLARLLLYRYSVILWISVCVLRLGRWGLSGG